MRARLSTALVPTAALILSLGAARAQDGASVPECGSTLGAADGLTLRERQTRGAYTLALPPAPSTTFTVQFAAHVVRRSDGTGGQTPAGIAQFLGVVNAAFLPASIQFVDIGVVDYIDDDTFYNSLNTQAEVDALRQTNVVQGAVNVYFTPSIATESGTFNGLSSFTFSPVQGIVIANGVSGAATAAHEMGHYFDLLHTHEQVLGIECPNGTNGSTAGDLVADTPADPNLFGVSPVTCNYTGSALPCGLPPNPDETNFMSFAGSCRTTFSPGQGTRALATLLNLRPELTFATQVVLVSVSSSSLQDPLRASGPAPSGVSADGRFVAFLSESDQLSPHDSNPQRDVFVRDTRFGLTRVASVDPLGATPAGGPGVDDADVSLSDDGRHVAFASLSDQLVGGDTNAQHDVFRRDLQTGVTLLVSRASGAAGAPGNAWSGRYGAAVSGDGNCVVFDTAATNLGFAAGGLVQVVLRDCALDTLEPVSLADGSSTLANGDCFHAAVSRDGRHVAFASDATNLVPGDTNGARDVFVRDRVAGTTRRVSVDGGGLAANGPSNRPALSRDGRFVAFETLATNLTAIAGGVVVHDTLLGGTRSAHVPLAGFPPIGDGTVPSLSGDGRYVAFTSAAAGNYVPGAGGGTAQVLLFDLATSTTTLLSRGVAGAGGNGPSEHARLSADGARVVFASRAANLVPLDANGILADAFVAPTGVVDPPYARVCTGDGLSGNCPCNNHSTFGAELGCRHSGGVGARLDATGTASLSNDTLVLAASGQPPGTIGLFFQGTSAASGGSGVQFGDGKICASGSIVRLGIQAAPTGASSHPGALDPGIASAGSVTGAPTERVYQLWFRDSAAFCTAATFNLTNGVRVRWKP